jgi:hypothetical protein
VRALLAVDDLWARALRLEQGVRDELLLGWLTPEQRDALTAALYHHQRQFLEAGELFDGLQAWEERLFATAPFPARGALLVGGAGAGREVRGLAARGYRVTAFEPNETMARCCDGTLIGGYRDLTAALDGVGPLGSLAARRFDGIVLGWGSLSCLTTSADRRALFAALARLWPGTPVVASWTPTIDAPPGRVAAVRAVLRRLLHALGAPGPVEGNELFYPSAGFQVSLTTDEVTALAAGTGYRVAVLDEANRALLCVPVLQKT